MIRKIVLTVSTAAALCVGAMAIAQAPSSPCGRIAVLEAELKELHAKNYTLYPNSRYAEAMQIKKAINDRDAELARLKPLCTQCTADVAAQDSKIAQMHQLYSSYTSNRDAAKKQALKAQIIAETNKLNDMKKACN